VKQSRAVSRALFIAALLASGGATAAQVPQLSYRNRLLGVFDAQSGAPIEGVEVGDMLSKASAFTTSTGTVALSFLPEGESLIRIRKVGYQPMALPVAISPADTSPLTILMKTSAQELPAIVTKDAAPRHIAPGLRAFEERRRMNAGGSFVGEGVLRKNDTKRMTYIARMLPGLVITCPTYGPRMGDCFARSTRSGCKMQFYMDGILVDDDDLEKLRVDEFAGVEYYAGGASVPPEYNKTGSSCGTLLLWTRG
jgi:hypothetical protein